MPVVVLPRIRYPLRRIADLWADSSSNGMVDMKLITVVWGDHCDGAETWQDRPTPSADLRPVFVETIGWLISESDEVMEIAGDRPVEWQDGKSTPDSEAEGWGRVCRILKATVVSRSDKPKKAKKPKKKA